MDIITGGCGWEGTMGWVDGQDGYGYRFSVLGWAGIERLKGARTSNRERGSTFFSLAGAVVQRVWDANRSTTELGWAGLLAPGTLP